MIEMGEKVKQHLCGGGKLSSEGPASSVMGGEDPSESEK